MNDPNTPESKARSASTPPSSLGALFNAQYYATSCGEPYQHNDIWLTFFGQVAEHIKADIKPGSVLDAGCAMGFLVESLRVRGIEAWGIDISAYAIQNVHEDLSAFCQVGSILDPFPHPRYELIVCIEVLEHLPPEQAEPAIANLCCHSDDILFSSTPDDNKEATHFNVQPAEYWAERFARHGFYPDANFDASFITPWAVRFVRKIQYTHPPQVHLNSFQNRPLLSTPQGGHVAVDVPLLALWQFADGRSLSEIISGFPAASGLPAEQALPKYIKTGLACLAEAGLLTRHPSAPYVETQDITSLPTFDAGQGPTVTAVIVNYHSKEWLKTCIPSLLAQTYAPLEIIVVDNGSHDGALEWLEIAYPTVRRLQIDQPASLAHGLNAGAALASPDSYLLLLNPDLRLEPDAVAQMVRVAQSDPMCAAVAAKLRLSWATPFLNGIGNQVRSFSFGTDNAIGHLDLGQFDAWHELPSACFAAALLTPAAWQAVGPVDESFAMYYEDVEWCYRARLLGFKVLAAPQAVIDHAFGGVIGPAGEKIPAGASEGLTPHKLAHAVYGRQRFITKLLKPRYLEFLSSYLHEDWAAYRNYRQAGVLDMARAYRSGWSRFLKILPALLRQRLSLQKRRQISDDTLFALQEHLPAPLVWNNLPELTWDLVTNLYTPLMTGERIRLMPEFTAPRRSHLLALCTETCPEIAPLAEQLHQQCAKNLDITLATSQPVEIDTTADSAAGFFQQVSYAPDRPAVLPLLIENCDIALIPGDLVRLLPDLEYTQARLIISLHDNALRQRGLDEMHRMLHLGDVYICTTEQRDFWLGALTAKGRGNIPLETEIEPLARYCREGGYAPDRSPRPPRFVPQPVIPTGRVARALYFWRSQGLRAMLRRTLYHLWWKLTHPQAGK
jgi:GT2 family glycosyltransferase/2-polyprenyl-3-methyl-5-hydroxy-6-metoxy-1,4-benzoquinol methylase